VETSEIGLAPPKRPRRPPKPPQQGWTTWASLPFAALAIAVGGVGAYLAVRYVDEGCPAGTSHGVAWWMMGTSVLLLTPAALVTGATGLWRGPAPARVAAAVAAVFVLAFVGYLYSAAYHWDIQCSVH
jgi:hypothetical protein